MPSDKATSDGERDERLVYEAQRAMDEMDRFLYEDDEWTMRKLTRFMRTCFPDPKQVRAVWDGVKKRLEAGNDLNSNEVRTYVQEASLQLVNEWLMSLDPFSRVAAASVYRQAEPTIHFKDFAGHFYVAPLMGGGKFGYIRGSPGRGLGVGKTMFALLEMEMALAEGMCVVTNIIVQGNDNPLLYRALTLKQVLKRCIQNLIAGHSTLVVLDEAPQFMPKERGTSKETVNMKQVMYLLRKISASLVVIAQREAEIPTAIIDLAVWKVQKKEKEIMLYQRENDRFLIVGVPPSKLQYDTRESASFVIDLDVMAMHDRVVQAEVANMESTKSQWQIILEYLDMDESKITKQDMKVAAKVMFCHGGCKVIDIATVMRVTKATIYAWLHEMGISTSRESDD